MENQLENRTDSGVQEAFPDKGLILDESQTGETENLDSGEQDQGKPGFDPSKHTIPYLRFKEINDKLDQERSAREYAENRLRELAALSSQVQDPAKAQRVTDEFESVLDKAKRDPEFMETLRKRLSNPEEFLEQYMENLSDVKKSTVAEIKRELMPFLQAVQQQTFTAKSNQLADALIGLDPNYGNQDVHRWAAQIYPALRERMPVVDQNPVYAAQILHVMLKGAETLSAEQQGRAPDDITGLVPRTRPKAPVGRRAPTMDYEDQKFLKALAKGFGQPEKDLLKEYGTLNVEEK